MVNHPKPTSSPSIVLMSDTSCLLVNLESDYCSLKLSEDLSSLLFEWNSDFSVISTVKFLVTNEEGIEIFSTKIGTCMQSDSHWIPIAIDGDSDVDLIVRLRIDAIYPLIFNASEAIKLIPNDLLVWMTEPIAQRKKYNMTITTLDTEDSDESADRYCTTDVHTAVLTAADTQMPVSRELLGLISPFFETLFFRDFVEKRTGVFAIKEVEDDFADFIDLLHKRGKHNFETVDEALSALTYADRFGITTAHEEAFSFLKSQSLSKESLKELFSHAARFNDNDAAILWILEQIDSVHDILDLIQTNALLVHGSAIQCAAKAAQSLLIRQETGVDMQQVAKDYAKKIATVRQRFFDEHREMISESVLKIPMDKDKDICMYAIWNELPVKYNRITIRERVFGRNDVHYNRFRYIRVHAPEVINMNVHHN